MRAEWNRELMGNVALAYQGALAALPRLLPHPTPVEAMYHFWPTAGGLAIEELGGALLAPLYAHLAESALFLAQVRRRSEGESALPRPPSPSLASSALLGAPSLPFAALL